MKMETIEKERVVRRALRKLLKEKRLVAAKRRDGNLTWLPVRNSWGYTPRQAQKSA